MVNNKTCYQGLQIVDRNSRPCNDQCVYTRGNNGHVEISYDDKFDEGEFNRVSGKVPVGPLGRYASELVGTKGQERIVQGDRIEITLKSYEDGTFSTVLSQGAKTTVIPRCKRMLLTDLANLCK